MAAALSSLLYLVPSSTRRHQHWLGSGRIKRSNDDDDDNHPFCSLPGPVTRNSSSPARFKVQPLQPGSVGRGGQQGLPAPAAALPGYRENTKPPGSSLPATLSEVAVQPPPPRNDARKNKKKKNKKKTKKKKEKKRKKKKVLSFTRYLYSNIFSQF